MGGPSGGTSTGSEIFSGGARRSANSSITDPNRGAQRNGGGEVQGNMMGHQEIMVRIQVGRVGLRIFKILLKTEAMK